MDDRFLRARMMLGQEGFARIQAAKVTVVGLGAVGGYAVEALARTGVGHLRLIDFDHITPSNINRQIFAMSSTLGRAKAEVARDRVLDISPDCQVEVIKDFIHGEQAAELVGESPSLIIDAIDSLNPKVSFLERVLVEKLPVISSMGAARRRDPALIRVGDISETSICPLARAVRKRLRRRGIQHGLTCVYSVEHPAVGEALADGGKEPRMDRGRVRQEMGSLVTITGIFGLTLGQLAIDWLTRST